MNDNQPPEAVIELRREALFPLTVTAGDSKIVLFANGTLQGDPKKLQAGLEALTMKDNGLGAVVLWLLLRELSSRVLPMSGDGGAF